MRSRAEHGPIFSGPAASAHGPFFLRIQAVTVTAIIPMPPGSNFCLDVPPVHSILPGMSAVIFRHALNSSVPLHHAASEPCTPRPRSFRRPLHDPSARPAHADQRPVVGRACLPCQRDTATRHYSVWRTAQVPCQFPVLRLRQSQGPQGRDVAPVRRGWLRQPQPVHQQGRAGQPGQSDLRHAVDPKPRRADDRVRPGGKRHRESPGQHLGTLYPAPRSALQRRSSAACRRRSVHLPNADQGRLAVFSQLLRRRRQGRGRRPAARAVHLQER